MIIVVIIILAPSAAAAGHGPALLGAHVLRGDSCHILEKRTASGLAEGLISMF